MPKPSPKKVVKKTAKPLALRVEELEDREEIRNLVNDMNWLSDASRLEDLVRCFSEDMVYDLGSFGVFRSRDELLQFLKQTVAAFSLRIHYVSNPVMEVNGERATCRCYWKAELVLEGRAIESSGHYLDELVKLRGDWKVKKRTATITYMCPSDEGWAKTQMMTLGQR